MLCVSIDTHSPAWDQAHMSAPIADGMQWGHTEEEEPGVPAEVPRRKYLDPTCALPLHRAGKYTMFVILF